MLEQGDGFLGLIAEVFAAPGAEIGKAAGGQDEALGAVAQVGVGIAFEAGPDAAFAGMVDEAGGV